MTSHASWALLNQSVSAARLESHRLRLLLARVLSMVESSSEKEHLYEVAGDVIQAVPAIMDRLDSDLDRTSYAISVFSEKYLRENMSIADRKMVDAAKESPSDKLAARVAGMVLADLNPQLGWPGGPCHVVERIEDEVRDPRLREKLKDMVEEGDKIENAEAAQIYKPLRESLPTGLPLPVGSITLTAHAQYRMDQRGVAVPQLRATIANFVKEWAKLRSQNHPTGRRWEDSIARGENIEWIDKKLGLTTVFVVVPKKPYDFRLVTTYWTGQPDDKPPGEGGCDITNRRAYSPPTESMTGYSTFRSKPDVEGFAGWSREDEVALPPGSATPGSAVGAGRDLPGAAYNTPSGTGLAERKRTLAVPGEQYGHPVKLDYGMPTRRNMTARKP